MQKVFRLVIWWRMNRDRISVEIMVALLVIVMGGFMVLGIFQPESYVPYAIVGIAWIMAVALAFKSAPE